MRFQVPQFTDVEDKIFGPLTFKQFIYLAGSAGACAILYFLVPIKLLAFVFMLPVAAFGVALAFYKVNNKPFIHLVEAFFKYTITSKLYIWKHEQKKLTMTSTPKELSRSFLPKLGESKLKDLTWSLGVEENQNPVTRSDSN
jgi:Cu/Ag efflux pump CusA